MVLSQHTTPAQAHCWQCESLYVSLIKNPEFVCVGQWNCNSQLLVITFTNQPYACLYDAEQRSLSRIEIGLKVRPVLDFADAGKTGPPYFVA